MGVSRWVARQPDMAHATKSAPTAELGYRLGYGPRPVPGIAHPIAIPAPVRAMNSLPRPGWDLGHFKSGP